MRAAVLLPRIPMPIALRRLLAASWLGWLVAAVAFTAIAAHTLSTWTATGGDLRNRIVGARAVAAGIDPFDLSAYNGGAVPAPELTDWLSWRNGLSAVTAPPTVLTFYSVFKDGDWTTIRMFWTGMEWLALLVSIVALSAAAGRVRAAGWIALLLTLAFAGSRAWQLHTLFGQYYIFPAALVSLDVLLLARNRAGWAGWFTGLAAAFRPSALIVAPVLWVIGHRRAGAACAVTGLALLLSSYASQPTLWQGLSAHTEKIVRLSVGPMTFDRERLELYKAALESAARDGVVPSRFDAMEAAVASGGTLVVPQNPGRERLFLHNWRPLSAGIAAAVAVVLLAAAWWCRRLRLDEAGVLLPAFGLSLADLSSPVANPYNFMMLLPAVGALAVIAMRRRLWWIVLALVPFAWVMHVSVSIRPILGIPLVLLVCALAPPVWWRRAAA